MNTICREKLLSLLIWYFICGVGECPSNLKHHGSQSNSHIGKIDDIHTKDPIWFTSLNYGSRDEYVPTMDITQEEHSVLVHRSKRSEDGVDEKPETETSGDGFIDTEGRTEVHATTEPDISARPEAEPGSGDESGITIPHAEGATAEMENEEPSLGDEKKDANISESEAESDTLQRDDKTGNTDIESGTQRTVHEERGTGGSEVMVETEGEATGEMVTTQESESKRGKSDHEDQDNADVQQGTSVEKEIMVEGSTETKDQSKAEPEERVETNAEAQGNDEAGDVEEINTDDMIAEPIDEDGADVQAERTSESDENDGGTGEKDVTITEPEETPQNDPESERELTGEAAEEEIQKVQVENEADMNVKSEAVSKAEAEGEGENAVVGEFAVSGVPEAQGEAEAESETEGEAESATAEYEEHVVIILVVCFSLVGILVVAGNYSLIHVITSRPSIRVKTANIYLLSLLISRACIGLFVVPGRITGMFSEQYLGTTFCKICHYAASGSLATSVISIVAMAIVRLREVKRAKAFGKWSLRRNCCMVVLIWVLGFTYAVRAPLVNTLTFVTTASSSMWLCIGDPEYSQYDKYFVLVDFCILLVVPLAIIIPCYFLVISQLNHDCKNSRQTAEDRRLSKRNRQSIKMIICLTILFVTCSSPPLALNLYLTWGGVMFDGIEITEAVLYLMSYSNAWINVIVFVYFRHDLRAAVLDDINKWIKRTTKVSSLQENNNQPPVDNAICH